jgi:hypothetical protein
MKTVERSLILAFFAVVVSASAFAQAESGRPYSYGAEFDVNSRYLWRSLAWSQGAVWQPSLWVGTSGFAASAWFNFPLGDEPNRRQFNEADFRLSYTNEWGDFTLEPAFNIYSYPNQDKEENPTTGELELAASYGFSFLTVSTTHFLDVWDNRGGYVGEIALEFEGEAGARLTANAAMRLTFGNAKFNAYYIPVDKAAVNAAILEVGLTYQLTRAITIRPHFEWNRLLDRDVRAAVAESPWVFSGKSSLANFGIAIGFEI